MRAGAGTRTVLLAHHTLHFGHDTAGYDRCATGFTVSPHGPLRHMSSDGRFQFVTWRPLAGPAAQLTVIACNATPSFCPPVTVRACHLISSRSPGAARKRMTYW